MKCIIKKKENKGPNMKEKDQRNDVEVKGVNTQHELINNQQATNNNTMQHTHTDRRG